MAQPLTSYPERGGRVLDDGPPAAVRAGGDGTLRRTVQHRGPTGASVSAVAR
ncbi:hypothetical protein SAMN05421541_1243 [Actinoplanes philippinensis]|uniref:Uncharacterized protein n=1 Tax=Actinoplanes philippinensis TaxID=35752 RepID=A0A1I2LYH9_9ACTN|nr:hypothetical protein [Actinoplanes philippinensis]SFF82186.1 hypothetical protein SAMN05421541_1243 [Actinoplanes philippinensis]